MLDKNKKISTQIKDEAMDIFPHALGVILNPEIVDNPGKVITQATLAYIKEKAQKLRKEVYEWEEDGKLKKENEYQSDKPKKILLEIERILKDEQPTDEKISVMKSLLFAALEKKGGIEKENHAYYFLNIIKQLDTEDIITLFSNFRLVDNIESLPKDNKTTNFVGIWLTHVSSEAGHNLGELILMREEKLVNMQLVSPRDRGEQYGHAGGTFVRTNWFRLTKLGFELCTFINEAENASNEKNKI